MDNIRRLNAKLYKALTEKDEDEVLSLCGDRPEGPMHVVTIHGDPVLHVALYSMQADLAEKLLGMFENLLAYHSLLAGTNAAGNTLLHEAATHDKFLPFAKKLLELQPQLLMVRNKNSETPLFSAARYGQMKMFKFLDAELYRTFDAPLYGTFFEDIHKTFHRKDDGSTILHAAIEAEHFKLACWMVKKYEYLHDKKNNEGLTALQLLACNPLAFRFRGKEWLMKAFIDSRFKNNNEDEDSHPHEGKVTCNYRVPWWDEMLGKRRRYNEAITLADILIQNDASWAITEEDDEKSADEENDETSADEEDDEKSADEEDDESTGVDSKNGAKKIEDELKNIEDRLKQIDKQKRTHQDKLKKSAAELNKIETELKETESQLKMSDQDELKKREAKLKREAELMKKRETELKEMEAELKKTYQVELMKETLAQLKKTDQDVLKKIEAGKKKTERKQIPLLLATQTGCLEIVYKILKVHPEAVEFIDKKGRSILHIAVEYRQMGIFEEVHKIMEVHMGRLIQRCDLKGNSILHMVGEEIRNEDVEQTEKYSPFFQLQEDLLLFERIKKLIEPNFYKHTNEDGKTAEELFALNKEALRDKSQEWLKRTAENFSINSLLIATIACTAAYTVPGGSKSDGSPALLNQTFFVVFIISDVLSLTFCLTSVVIFFSILTNSSFKLEEFKLALPQKLMLAITCLLFSVTMMILAFSATIILIVHNNEQNWTKISLYTLAVLPVTVLAIVYMPLFFSLTKTFKHSLKKIKSFFPKSIDQK